MAPFRRVFARAGRRTNLALLIVLAGAFLTGWLAFAAGTPVPSRLATVGHGLLGLGVVVLVPWKTVVVRRAPMLRLASLGSVRRDRDLPGRRVRRGLRWATGCWPG